MAVILAMLPFLLPTVVLLGPLFDALYAAMGWNQEEIIIARSLLAIAKALFVLGGLLAGWLKGFPRWTYPYLGLVVTASLLLANGSTPGLWLFGYQRGRALWGWWAWVPLLAGAVTAVLILLISRPIKQQFRMVTNVWGDWTMLSFAIYGMFILGTFVALDEIQSPWEGMITALGALLLALGAGATMRAGTTGRRIAALIMGFSAAYILLVGFSAVYWQTQTDFSSAVISPSSVVDVINTLYKGWLFFALFLLSPALIGLLRRFT